MTPQKQQILLATTGDQQAFVKVIGQGTCQISPGFKSLMIDLCNRGFRSIAVDFGECLSVDSTFIGVLAKSGDCFQSTRDGQRLLIAASNQRVRNSISSLGVEVLFHFTDSLNGSMPAVENFSEFSQPEITPEDSKKEVCRTSIEAHSKLCELSQENNDKFKHVLDFLKADLDTMKDRQ